MGFPVSQVSAAAGCDVDRGTVIAWYEPAATGTLVFACLAEVGNAGAAPWAGVRRVSGIDLDDPTTVPRRHMVELVELLAVTELVSA